MWRVFLTVMGVFLSKNNQTVSNTSQCEGLRYEYFLFNRLHQWR